MSPPPNDGPEHNHRHNKHRRFLDGALAELHASLDWEETVQKVARLAVPDFADWCVVQLFDENQQLTRVVALHHRDERAARRARRVLKGQPYDPDAPYGPAQALRTGEPLLYTDISDEMIRRSARSPEHRDMLLDANLGSSIMVPLKARGEQLGVLSFFRHRGERRYDEQDVRLAQDLADHAALALDNARLYRQSQAAQRRADRRARQQAAVADLGQQALELQLDELFERALHVAREQLGADAAKIIELRRRDSKLVLRAGVGWRDALIGQPLSGVGAQTAIGQALRGRQVVVEDFATSDYQRTDLVAESGMQSEIAAQIPGADRPWGVLAIHSRTPTHFSVDDVDLTRSVANILSAAIERHHAETQRLRTFQRLLEVMEHREDLLSTVSHEMRNPAATIKMHLQLIREAAREEPPAVEEVLTSVEGAEDNIDRMITLMTDLLDSAREEVRELTLDPEACDCADLVRGVVESHRAALATDVSKLELSVPENLDACIDFVRFEQVVSNLLGNAIKYGDGNSIALELTGSDDWIELTVRDHGIGIPTEDQSRIFERFERAEGEGRAEGFGLGLWLVDRIVEVMGGSVEVDSEEGVGSTFRVRIPRWDE